MFIVQFFCDRYENILLNDNFFLLFDGKIFENDIIFVWYTDIEWIFFGKFNFSSCERLILKLFMWCDNFFEMRDTVEARSGFQKCFLHISTSIGWQITAPLQTQNIFQIIHHFLSLKPVTFQEHSYLKLNEKKCKRRIFFAKSFWCSFM